jgi:hypothetical protein
MNSSNLSTDAQTQAPIRGAIRTAVSTSTEDLVAGQNFSIFVTIQNPFEVPLALHRVSTYLPTEFIDIDQLERSRRAAVLEQHIAEIEEAGRDVGLKTSGILPPPRSRLSEFLRRFSGVSLRLPGAHLAIHAEGPATAVARDLSATSEQLTVGLSLPMGLGSITRTISRDLRSEVNPEEAKRIWREQLEDERKRYSRALNTLQLNPTLPTNLQAGNSTTRVFTLRSREQVWFRPASYRLQIEVQYEIGGVVNIDSIDRVLSVKASLSSMLLGSLLGGLAGWAARHGTTAALVPADALGAAIALILAAMTVVLFARKKDVQPIIAVEDFWGGVAIGFLVAYSGQGLLRGLIGSNNP